SALTGEERVRGRDFTAQIDISRVGEIAQNLIGILPSPVHDKASQEGKSRGHSWPERSPGARERRGCFLSALSSEGRISSATGEFHVPKQTEQCEGHEHVMAH